MRLGLVKFMFPNPYNIYLHDTPAKNLFGREVRAYSTAACAWPIRLTSPTRCSAVQTDDPEGLLPVGPEHRARDARST